MSAEHETRGKAGRLFFGYFLLAKQKKVTCCRGFAKLGSDIGTRVSINLSEANENLGIGLRRCDSLRIVQQGRVPAREQRHQVPAKSALNCFSRALDTTTRTQLEVPDQVRDDRI